MEETQAGGKKGENRRRFVLAGVKRGGSAGLIVILQEAGELILVIDAGAEMVANRPDMPFAETIVKALVVSVIEALLLHGPFHVPVHFRHETELGMLIAHAPGGFRPEWRRRDVPCLLKNFREDQHRHVAAHAITMPGNSE